MKVLWGGLVAGAAALPILAGPAQADGYAKGSLKDAPVPVAYEWNGLSVGIGVGVGKIDQDAEAKAWRHDVKCQDQQIPALFAVVSPCGYGEVVGTKHQFIKTHASDDDWNWFGTVQVGYDRLLGERFLAGVFADFDFYDDSDLSFSKYGNKGAFLKGSVEVDNIWTIGGRLGFLVTPRVLFYGLLAYSHMSVDGNLLAHFDDPFPYPHNNPTNLGVKIEDSVGGLTVGGGIEAKLASRLSLKLEYRYSKFDELLKGKVTDYKHEYWSYEGINYSQITSEGAKLAIGESDMHSVRAVLSLKLGSIHDERAAPLK